VNFDRNEGDIGPVSVVEWRVGRRYMYEVALSNKEIEE
jgi:hypothetical protein